MATYKGNDIASPDRLDADLLLVGKRLGGLENVEEELNLPPSAEPDALRRPGQKGYMETQPMADKGIKEYGGTPDFKGIKEYGGTPGPTKGVQEYGGTPGPTKGVQEYGGATKPKALDDPEAFIMDYPPYGNRQRPDRYAQGGMVKHGSSTRVSCNKKG